MTWPTSGRVAEVPFARVVGALTTRRLTGVLRLEQDSRRHVTYWLDGAIADADPGVAEDTLGRVALEAGLVDSSAVGESLRKMAQSPNRSQRQILEEMGALKGEALERAVRFALTRRALRTFGLPGATYAIEDSEHGRLEGGPVEPRWSLYQGLRTYYDERRLDLEMAPLSGNAVRLAVEAADIYDRFGFSDEERIVLAYMQKAGFWELPYLVEACLTVPRPVVLAVVHSLHAFEALEVQPASKVQTYRKKAREQTVQISRDSLSLEPQGAPPAAPPTGVKFTPPQGARLSAGGVPVPTANPQVDQGAPLRVAPSSAEPSGGPPDAHQPRAAGTNPPLTASQPAAPVAARPPTRSTLTHPLLPPPPRASTPSPTVPARAPGTIPPFGPRVDTQPGVAIASARGAPSLGTVALGRRQQIAVKVAAIDANADHFAILEVGRDATSDQIKAAYFQLALNYHPDRLASQKLEELRPLVARIFVRLSDAYNGLRDEGRRREYLALLAQGGTDAAKRRADEDNEKAVSLLTAEEHCRQGEMALRRQNWKMAVREFQAALDMNGAEAEHHALLAWAKFSASSDKEAVFAETKAGLHKAIQLNYRCVKAFYHLGQVYSAIGDVDRAYGSFQKVLDLEETHVDASREVRIIEMRRKAGDKRGLFDRFGGKKKK